MSTDLFYWLDRLKLTKEWLNIYGAGYESLFNKQIDYCEKMIKELTI